MLRLALPLVAKAMPDANAMETKSPAWAMEMVSLWAAKAMHCSSRRAARLPAPYQRWPPAVQTE